MASGDYIFRDTFTEGSNTNLTSHTPDTGTSWTQINQVGGAVLRVVAASDDLRPTSSNTSAGQTLVANATYPSADYQVEIQMTGSVDLHDEYINLIGRYTAIDTDGMYMAYLDNNTSRDFGIYVAQSPTAFSAVSYVDNSDNNLLSTNSYVLMQLVGSEQTLYVDEVSAVYGTDTFVTSAGKAGIGYGADWAAALGDTDTTKQITDNFSVYQVGGSNTGYRDPTTTGETNNQWTDAGSSASSAYASNDTRAIADVTTSTAKKQDYGDFGISTSGNAATGIQVRVELQVESTIPVYTYTIELSKDNGSTYPYSKTISFDHDAASTDRTFVFGHARSLWGTTWSSSDLSDANFRVRIGATHTSSTREIRLDHISTRVFYDTATAVNITTQNASHAHATTSPAVTQTHSVTSQNTTHAHSPSSPQVTQTQLITTQGATHSHSAENVTIDQSISIVTNDSSHTHTSTSPAVTQTQIITTQSTSHSHSATTPAITQTHAITISNSSHTTTSSEATIATDIDISVNNSSHTQTASAPTVTMEHNVTTQNTTHSQSATAPTNTQTHVITTQNSSHDHSAGNVTATIEYNITTDNGAHAQSATQSTIVLVTEFDIAAQDAAHTVTSDTSPISFPDQLIKVTTTTLRLPENIALELQTTTDELTLQLPSNTTIQSTLTQTAAETLVLEVITLELIQPSNLELTLSQKSNIALTLTE